MLRLYAERFVDASNYLGALATVAEQFEDRSETINMQSGDLVPANIKKNLDQLLADREALKLRLTVIQIKRLLNNTNDLEPKMLQRHLHSIFMRFRDELEDRAMYWIPPDRSVYYEEPLQGWSAVIDRFGCAFDVEEARKCVALERYTAAVFHLMKIVEAAVLELRVFLDEKPDARAGFGSVLKKLEQMTQREKFTHIDVNLRPYLGFMQETLAQLHAVKDSWRDRVAHTDEGIVPIDTFTEEMAAGSPRRHVAADG
jgi:hypothetical protein